MELNGSKLDHVWEMTEDDGGVRRLTTNALENAPVTPAGLSAADVRTAVGLATANLDTQLAGLPTDLDVQAAATAALNAYDPPTNTEMEARTIAAADYLVAGDLSGLATATNVSDAVTNILNGVIEGTITLKQAQRAMLSFIAGKASGGNTTNPVFRDTGDTKNRISMTVDVLGNRSAVTLDLGD
jgi:hypothetical protein